MIQKGLRIISLCFIGAMISCSNSVEPGSEDDNNSSSSVARSSSSVRSSSSTNPEQSSSSISIAIDLGSVTDLKVSKSISDNWLLTWVYTPGTVEEKGFQIDFYNEKENEWQAYDTVSVGNYRYVFNDTLSGTFRVSAFNGQRRSTFSNEVIIYYKTAAADPTEKVNLGAVAQLSVSKNTSDLWLLNWVYTPGTVEEKGFQIDIYNDTKNAWEPFDTVATGTYRYLFNKEVLGVYRVSAFNEQGQSTFSNEVIIYNKASIINPTEKLDLGSVAQLTVSKNASDLSLLTWIYTPGTDVEKGFQIDKYNESANVWERHDTVGVGTYRYVFNDTISGAFRVSAYNEQGQSTFSNEVIIYNKASIINPTEKLDLGSVAQLTVSKNASDLSLLTWIYTPGTDVEKGFQIDKYNESANVWERHDTVGVGTYRYVFNDTISGAFRVSAYNEQGQSTFSNEVSITNKTPMIEIDLGSVMNLSMTKNSSGSWILTWKHVQGTDVENGFEIDLFNDATNTWESFDSVGVGTYRYVFGSNTPGVYRVSAFNEKGRSSYSNELEVQNAVTDLIHLQKPTNLVGIRLAPSIWQLSWNYTAIVERRENGFIIEKYDPTLLKWIVWDTVDTDVKRIVLDSVVGAVDLSLGSYRVAAFDSLGRSDYSNDIQVNIQTEYSPDIIFVPPTDMVPNASNSAYLELLIPTNPVNKSVEFSPYTASLSYEALWVIEDTEESPVSFSFSKNSVTHSVDPATNALCDSYARIRLVWTDINGVVDYSEWSVPTGSKPGTRGSGLIDLKESPNCPELIKVGQ